MSAISRFTSLKNAVLKFIGQGPAAVVPEAPVAGEDPQKTHEYIQQLFDEGLQYENDHFTETAPSRVVLGGSNNKEGLSPQAHRLNCDRLAAGNLWDAIGHRNTGERDKWKSEVTEGLTQRNMRVRGSYISSAWHDVTIIPNIQNIGQIFDQERMATDWSDFVDEYREIAQKYGIASARVYFEDDEDKGHVRVMVIKPGTIVRTPNSTGYAERDGCWYVVQGTMINDKRLKKFYPDIEDPYASQVLSNKFDPIGAVNRGNYSHTKMYAKLECFMDDDTIEEKQVTPDENAELASELEALTLGQPVPSKMGQNGKLHIGAKTEALQNFLSMVDENTMSEEDANYATSVIDVFTANIEEHTAAMEEGDLAALGLQKKYPFGRYICSVGGKLAEDIPNPNRVPWRKLFEDVKNEKVSGRNDGRSDPEIYFHDEKTASRALSKFLDTVTTSIPKRYRKIDDKMNKKTESQLEDNDPTRVGYFVSQPPVNIAGKVSAESLAMRDKVVQKAELSQGVNSVSVGAAPERQTSGFQTQLLQKQNEVQVSGELDRNLRVAIENIVESMLEMYKVFYAEPREYTILGTKRLFNVSRMLTQVPGVDENGQPTIIQNPKFEITARPFSNYPNRFEVELAEVSEIYTTLKDENGVPLLPSDAVFDVLAMKYPEAAPNGKWRKLSKATQIGLQVMAEEQKKAEEEQKRQDQLSGAMDAVDRGMVIDQYKKDVGADTPSISISYKDLPVEGQVQAAADAGIVITTDAAKKHMTEMKPKPATPNNGKR